LKPLGQVIVQVNIEEFDSILDTAQLCDVDASSKSHNYEEKNFRYPVLLPA
jgi:hypothetical protein